MAGNPLLLAPAAVLDFAGIVGLLLTHFGVVPGFQAISPILFGASAVLYLLAFGMPPHWLAILVVFAIATGFFELVFRFNLWGLGAVAYLGAFSA